MAKNKQQKAKDRERRVAQKKLAETEKRTSEQSAKKSQAATQKTNKLASAVPHPTLDQNIAKPKSSFIRRRSMG